MIPPEIAEFAEIPDRFTKPTPGFTERVDTGRFVVLRTSTWAAVSAVQVGEGEVEAVVPEVAALTESRRPTWWVGPSSRPRDLVARLRALGFRDPEDRVSELISFASVLPPSAPREPVEVRRVSTLDDHVVAAELRWEAFGVPPARRDDERPTLERAFRAQQAADSVVEFLALADGRPAATGSVVVSPRGLFLFGGATAPWARGRGLYRALVGARWDEAVRRGTPALVVQADPATSAPILRRLGFVEVCRQRRLSPA